MPKQAPEAVVTLDSVKLTWQAGQPDPVTYVLEAKEESSGIWEEIATNIPGTVFETADINPAQATLIHVQCENK